MHPDQLVIPIVNASLIIIIIIIINQETISLILVTGFPTVIITPLYTSVSYKVSDKQPSALIHSLLFFLQSSLLILHQVYGQ